jgi:hypothetical protein
LESQVFVVQDGSKTRKENKKKEEKKEGKKTVPEMKIDTFLVSSHIASIILLGEQRTELRETKKKWDEGKGSESMERRTSTVIFKIKKALGGRR